MRHHVVRVVSTIAVTATLLVAAIVSPTAAGAAPKPPPPRHGWTVTGPTPQSYPPETDPAGDPCAFPIRVTFPVNKVVADTYKNAKGRVVAIYFTGALYERLTNLDTGKSILSNVSGDGMEIPYRDGSTILYGFGPFSSTQHPGDHPGPEFAVLHGISALRVAADGTKTILYSTRVTNLCDRL
jgi:hypothetical protein